MNLKTKKSVGVTITELMVTVAIVAILVALAYPNLRIWQRRNQLKNTTNTITMDLEWARMRAMEREKVVIKFTPQVESVYFWANDGDIYVETTELSFLKTTTFPSGVSLADSLDVSPDTLYDKHDNVGIGITFGYTSGDSNLVFNRRGLPEGDTDSLGGGIYLTDGTEIYAVTVSSGGAIKMARYNSGTETWE